MLKNNPKAPLAHSNSFCTYLARNYILQFLALYGSLQKTCSSFQLWVLCMDQITYKVLARLRLTNVRLISLAEFEDAKLKLVKSKRTLGEYCWTCTPSLILYVLEHNPQIDILGYIDADVYFFSSPAPVYQEFGNNSILLTPHRHAPEYAYLRKRHGIYNVGLLLFRNDKSAKEALAYWRRRCLAWCSVVPERGKYGDQAYLNVFPDKFRGVYVLTNIAADVAPWNVSAFHVTGRNGTPYVNSEKIIFYHFAGFRFYADGTYEPVGHDSFFRVSPNANAHIYKIYHQAILSALRQVKHVEPDFSFGTLPPPEATRSIFRIKQTLGSFPLVYGFSAILYTLLLRYRQSHETRVLPTGVSSAPMKFVRNATLCNCRVTRVAQQNLLSGYNIYPSGVAYISEAVCIYCPSGSCAVSMDTPTGRRTVILSSQNPVIEIQPKIWHTLHHLTPGTTVMILSKGKLSKLAKIYSRERLVSYIQSEPKK